MQIEFKDRKKVTPNQTSYYSGLITNKAARERPRDIPIAARRTNLQWQVKTEKYSMIIPKLVGPARTRFLAPNTRWVIGDPTGQSDIAFPFEAFKPKAQMEYVVPPGHLPRGVEIERRRRRYASKNITELLENIGIQLGTLIPPKSIEDLMEEVDVFGMFSSVNFLPLELFDDEDFDGRLPAEWLELGIVEGVQHPVCGVAFIPSKGSGSLYFEGLIHGEDSAPNLDESLVISNLYVWTTVAVTKYSPDTKLYEILTMEACPRIYTLPRIYVMFKAEDPENFAFRILDAVMRRNHVETMIKYELFLDCAMLPGIPEMPQSCIARLYDMATRNGCSKYKGDLERLEAEVRYIYRRTMCHLSFQGVYNGNEMFHSFIRLPKTVEEKPAPQKACVTVPTYDYGETRRSLSWIQLYVIAETYWAVKDCVKECFYATGLSLFANLHGRSVALEEFESMQNTATVYVMNILHGVWLENISRNTTAALRVVGKGWFNIYESKWEIYNQSKLSRMMTLIKFRMQGALRELVKHSIEQYCRLLETPCLCTLGVEPDFQWGQDVMTTQFQPDSPAVFTVHLKIDETKVYYSTNPLQYEPTIIHLYDTAVIQTHTVSQVHPRILHTLKFAENLLLSSIGLLEKEVDEIRGRLQIAYRQAIIPLIAYSQEYLRHIDLWKLNIVDYVKEYEAENHPANEVKEEVAFQIKMRQNLEMTLPDKITIGPFLVVVDPLKRFLVQKRLDLSTKLLDMFAKRMRKQIDEVLDEYKVIMVKLSETPLSIEHIFDIRDWMETITMTVRNLEEVTKRLLLEYEILEYFWYPLNQEDFECKWEAIGWPNKLAVFVETTIVFLEDEVANFMQIQVADEAALQEKIEFLTGLVANLTLFGDITKVHETAVDVRKIWKQMKECQEQGQLLNQRQKLFAVPVVPFDALTKLLKEFEPYRNLWGMASDWMHAREMWMDNPLVNVDGEAIDRLIVEYYRTAVKSMRVFAEIPAVQQVAAVVRQQIDDFRPHIPLIQSLRNPGMRPRHWEMLNEQTGVNIIWSVALTYSRCRELGIEQEIEALAAISESAAKEYAIEQTLDKMAKEWDLIELEVTPYKNSGTYIMKIADEVSQMLDDHMSMTQQISFSPFKAVFEEKIADWEEKLTITAEVMELWIECQKQWMYLEPIFTSEDINRQLPAEAKKYNSMDRTWRRIMKSAFDTPRVMSVCPDRRLVESLKECNHLLEQVQRGLADYLETKRIVFPRFYFLSDDELLEIVAQAKNPTAVQPHLRKCFENIARLDFQEDLEIIAMFSGEGERVSLHPSMYPVGNVENWLLKVESIMMNTVRYTLGNSLDDLMVTERNEWVLQWPGQIVIAGCQTYWTFHVEEGLRNHSLPEYFELMLEQLDGLRSLVKGPLKRVERQVLSALIVIEVHARDVTEKLVIENVSTDNDFDWISQLRYYWIDDVLKVRAVNAEFLYGNEYLGNSGRLVITPLTDRCYLTLTGALHLKFGGAPAGPAGTGKTETTKDLAKAFAIQCVVFNCSDQLDFMAMGKFFKGLASSGAWACFDEFNRIDIEVLSVVAQQVVTIQKAQQQRLDRFMFEGAEIALKDSCAVFITMNPGYAGRTELPDNLKALFRPVAMMVPNYALIAEISLFSFGFSDAKELAGKITTTFKLSSEQLSSQDHYDFGMRAVKTVIAVAGNLKRENPTMDERQIVLRSLRDVNVPKFLKDDLKLFNGIVSDLFPRMVEQAVDHGELEKSIRKTLLAMALEDVDDYVKKVIQLYETTVVRHGLMLVGPTGSGKTKCYEALKDAMTAIKGLPSPSGLPFEPVHSYVLNPKSITMGQLYGEFDALTHEWTDGILASLVRSGSLTSDLDKRWYVFDGPVDAVWIENMNTVLDDNKKLCLSSGEIIKLTDAQTMMFEVADLAVASPATVSRCGMVYLEPSVLGLPPFLNCWIKLMPKLAEPYGDDLQELFAIYLLPGVELLRSHMKELVGSVDSAIVMSCLHMMDIRLRPLANPDGKPPPPAQFLRLIPGLLAPWVIFAVIWTVGATCDHESRVIFSTWIREVMSKNDHEPLFPAEGLVYDYKLNDGGFNDTTEDGEPAAPTWHHWMESVDAYVITPEMKYSDIEVPTIDNVRCAEVLGMVVHNERPALCVGPTGTGKTVTVVAKLSRGLHKKFMYDFLTFSARTSANQTQDLIDSKLDKRRKGVFGPPILKKQVFFIDDLNMPALETYGAQPPIELIRQWCDFKGWYDRRAIGEWRQIIDVTFVGAMGPPGGGRNPVTLRLLRHFHYIAFTELEDSSKRCIFDTIVSSWLSRTPDLAHLLDAVVSATLSVYATILSELLPTPAKTHYTFNLRDLSKVFQGMLMVDPEAVTEKDQVVVLWYHECCRVFQDRLVNDKDRAWFDDLLRQRIASAFLSDADVVLGDGTILFGDFLDPNVDVRLYDVIKNMAKLQSVLSDYLEEYNGQTTAPMKLVLFLDAICHVCRIARIIRQPLGNALLLGMGGSGRQSLTRLATFMNEFVCFSIELSKNYSMTEWRDDIKNLMLRAGLQRRETVFLFSDTQIKNEAFLEDLNNILNSGDVPNIYQADELDRIYLAMRGTVQEQGLLATKSNLFGAYLKVVRTNLHVVIAMSPIGEIFRARLRQFPALVNCCTIDWFSAWPDTALQSVAFQFLDDIPNLEVSGECLKGIVNTCQFMHQSVVDASELYLQELSRHNYVTPTSYLELLSSYSRMMDKKKGDLMAGVKRLKTGLDKLLTTGEEVKVLQVELTAMRPALMAAAEDAAVMLTKIAADQEVAEETRAVVEAEEFEAAKQSMATAAIKEDAQRDLDEAMPLLQAAENSLKELNKNDITEVRVLKSPPVGVKYVMEALCIVKDVKPNKVPGKKPGEKINDYWEPGRGLLTNPDHFLQSLMNFDKDSISEAIITKLKEYVDNPLFQPAKIITVSKACTSLCMWVHAMYKYYFVNKAVAPKKAALAEAQASLAVTEAQLALTRARMKAVQDGLAVLEEELRATEEHKADLEAKAKVCEDRMGRAVRLVSGLADERERWIVTVADSEVSLFNVVGDILISSAAVAYLTPFTDKYRRRLLTMWLQRLVEQGVPHTAGCSPVSTLAEPVQVRKWQLEGLPRDSLSTENAVLVQNSRRWPLFIDPQGQANRWVRNMGKEMGLAVAKLSDRDLLRTIESCVRFGKPCLIENVGTELDPALDPVLQRLVYKQGGQLVLKLGDAIVPYSDDFQLFITTKLPNPHYTPEVAIKVLLVNFTLVPSGLQDQLLALVVMEERPDLEEARSAIIISSAQMKHELKEIEDRILHRLSASEGSPVDDIDLIVTLEASKIKSEEIKFKVESAEKTQIDIDTTRALYIPVANRAQILFFCLSDLANIDPMYQYSLEWFINIFLGSMINTEKSGDINERKASINDYFTFSLYTNVCRSLFEKHKLHFAFLLCARIMLDDGDIDPQEWQMLLAGGSPAREVANPDPSWISPKAWKEILCLETLPKFEGIVADFPRELNGFKRVFESMEPENEELPGQWSSRLNDFQQLLMLKSLRPDKVTNAMQTYLSVHLGDRFIEPQSTELAAMYKESSNSTPLIFVLSTGTDPAAELYKFSDKMKMSKRLFVISLGQGQGPRAELMLRTAMDIGSWVFFQNCHLAPSWMPRLETLVEAIQPDQTHKEFRVWLTSTPSPHFPVSILQNGSKMTVEPPRGIKANILRAYSNQVTELQEFFHSDHEKVGTFKWLLFSLCLFHGACIERRKFGPLGFNIPYEFTDGDLRICISQLQMFLLEYSDIPFKVLIYTAGQINYGGRVTDDWDRRCIMNILQDYYSPSVVDESFTFDQDGHYHQLPADTILVDYMTYLRTLPLNDHPTLFGLHANADISSAQRETYRCLETLLALQPRTVGSAGGSQEDETVATANGIMGVVPKPFPLAAVQEKYPVMYEESLNTVLVQEVIRYNRLLGVIHSSLRELLRALKGLVVMSASLEAMSQSLYINIVPAIWAGKAYPSLKPLGAWVNDLRARIAFLGRWIEEGIPAVFWISGFYFPQAFLTGTLQNFARKYIVSIDAINFGFKVLRVEPKERPKDGCCITGLFLEGCRWSVNDGVLVESNPKELYTDMPVMWLTPEERHVVPESGIYECPVYKTLTRAGTLSTTGHSTNYVLAIEVPSDKPQRHWIKRGVALICALDY